MKWPFSRKSRQTDEEFLQSIVNGVQSYAQSLRSEGLQSEIKFYCSKCENFIPIEERSTHQCEQNTH